MSLRGWSKVSLWSQLRGWKQNSLVALPIQDRVTLQVQVPPHPGTQGPHPAHSRDRPEAERPVKVTHEPQAGLGPAPGSLLHPSILKWLPLLLRFKAAMFLLKSFPPAACSPSPTIGEGVHDHEQASGRLYLPIKSSVTSMGRAGQNFPGALAPNPSPPRKMCFLVVLEPEVINQVVCRAMLPPKAPGEGPPASGGWGAPWLVAASPIPALVVTWPLLGVCIFSSSAS